MEQIVARYNPLPAERKSITHKFSIVGYEGYLTIGLYEDGSPGEIFIVLGTRENSTIAGITRGFADTCSLALQYGVPFEVLFNKFAGTRFEPAGFTSNPDIPYAKSIIDYVFRYMELKFLPKPKETPITIINDREDPVCFECGSLMVRSGDGYRCLNCGAIQGNKAE